jgi:hypothetical protein
MRWLGMDDRLAHSTAMTTGRFLVVALVTLGTGIALLAIGGTTDEPLLEVAGAACFGLTFLARAAWQYRGQRRQAAFWTLTLLAVVVVSFLLQRVFG